jgi:hypothetical protein
MIEVLYAIHAINGITLTVLVGVDVCTGLIWFDDTGLEIDVSDKTLNWFVVLKTMEKQNDL